MSSPHPLPVNPLLLRPAACYKQAVPSALEEETRRLYERYQTEVVEAFGLCPWARTARISGNTALLVKRGQQTAPSLLHALEEAQQSTSEIVLLLLPEYMESRLEFERLTAELIRLDALRYQLRSPPFALAAFHPAADDRPDATRPSQAERLIPFLRRTPDATLQLVRLTALERVRKGESEGTQFVDPAQLDLTKLLTSPVQTSSRLSLRRRIAVTNQATLAGDAGAELCQRMRDILLDRFLTHQRLGLPACSWEQPLTELTTL